MRPASQHLIRKVGVCVKGTRETIETFRNELEAHLARTTLNQEGIAATVHRYSRYKAMSGGGYVLKVDSRDAAKAREIIGGPNDEVDMDEYVDSDDTSYRRCPECTSVNVTARPLSGKLTILSLLTVGLLLMFLKRDWTCKKCGHQWRG